MKWFRFPKTYSCYWFLLRMFLNPSPSVIKGSSVNCWWQVFNLTGVLWVPTWTMEPTHTQLTTWSKKRMPGSLQPHKNKCCYCPSGKVILLKERLGLSVYIYKLTFYKHNLLILEIHSEPFRSMMFSKYLCHYIKKKKIPLVMGKGAWKYLIYE